MIIHECNCTADKLSSMHVDTTVAHKGTITMPKLAEWLSPSHSTGTIGQVKVLIEQARERRPEVNKFI
jgi:hypothetical protein